MKRHTAVCLLLIEGVAVGRGWKDGIDASTAAVGSAAEGHEGLEGGDQNTGYGFGMDAWEGSVAWAFTGLGSLRGVEGQGEGRARRRGVHAPQ